MASLEGKQFCFFLHVHVDVMDVVYHLNQLEITKFIEAKLLALSLAKSSTNS